MNAERVPDLTIGAGRRRIEEARDGTWVFEVSVPLPLFDRKGGAVMAAEARAAAARMRRNAGEARLRGELRGVVADLEIAVHEVEVLEREVLPAAREVLGATDERYRSGKVGFLDLLDARRTLAEASVRQLEALAAVHTARIAMERLVAGPLDGDPGKESDPEVER